MRVDPTAAVAPSRIERGIEAALPADDPLPALLRIDSDWLRTLRNRWEATNKRLESVGARVTIPKGSVRVLSRLGFGEPGLARHDRCAGDIVRGLLLLIIQRVYAPPAYGGNSLLSAALAALLPQARTLGGGSRCLGRPHRFWPRG